LSKIWTFSDTIPEPQPKTIGLFRSEPRQGLIITGSILAHA